MIVMITIVAALSGVASSQQEKQSELVGWLPFGSQKTSDCIESHREQNWLTESSRPAGGRVQRLTGERPGRLASERAWPPLVELGKLVAKFMVARTGCRCFENA